MLFKDPNYALKLPSNFKYQNINARWSKTNIKAEKTASLHIKKYKISDSRLKFSHKFDFLFIPIYFYSYRNLTLMIFIFQDLFDLKPKSQQQPFEKFHPLFFQNYLNPPFLDFISLP